MKKAIFILFLAGTYNVSLEAIVFKNNYNVAVSFYFAISGDNPTPVINPNGTAVTLLANGNTTIDLTQKIQSSATRGGLNIYYDAPQAKITKPTPCGDLAHPTIEISRVNNSLYTAQKINTGVISVNVDANGRLSCRFSLSN